jgi:hypothetical protein
MRFWAPLTIGLRAENLLNDDIRYSTSFKKDEVLQPSTHARLFGIVKLNWVSQPSYPSRAA